MQHEGKYVCKFSGRTYEPHIIRVYKRAQVRRVASLVKLFVIIINDSYVILSSNKQGR
jgi:hypothetical protein